MPENQPNWSVADAINSDSLFTVYGVPIKDPALGEFRGVSPSLKNLAYIKAYAIGEFCHRLTRPILMLVPGPGQDPKDDKCAKPPERKWEIVPSDRTVVLAPTIGNFSDLLEEAATRGIDGGIRLENPRIQDGKACVDVHIWASIEIFGAKVGFDERFPICVPLEGCRTVWDIGWASLEVCFRAPNQLCAKLCIGKWGLSKCWDYCVSLPIPAPAVSGSCGCTNK